LLSLADVGDLRELRPAAAIGAGPWDCVEGPVTPRLGDVSDRERDEGRKQGLPVRWLLAACVVLVVAIFAAISLTRNSVKVHASGPPLSQRFPLRPSPTPSPMVQGTFPAKAIGSQLSLKVDKVGTQNLMHVLPCRLHGFRGSGFAYVTDCRGVNNSTDKDLLLIAVVLTNTTDVALHFDIENFLIVTKANRTYDPVDIRSDFQYAPWLMPRAGLVAPHGSREAWLTFDRRLTYGLKSFDYVDEETGQTLEVLFDGRAYVRTAT
jgi:hypothetical protein